MDEATIQKVIATALNNAYPTWGAWSATSRDGLEYVEFIKEATGERYIISIQKGQ